MLKITKKSKEFNVSYPKKSPKNLISLIRRYISQRNETFFKTKLLTAYLPGNLYGPTDILNIQRFLLPVQNDAAGQRLQ